VQHPGSGWHNSPGNGAVSRSGPDRTPRYLHEGWCSRPLRHQGFPRSLAASAARTPCPLDLAVNSVVGCFPRDLDKPAVSGTCSDDGRRTEGLERPLRLQGFPRSLAASAARTPCPLGLAVNSEVGCFPRDLDKPAVSEALPRTSRHSGTLRSRGSCLEASSTSRHPQHHLSLGLRIEDPAFCLSTGATGQPPSRFQRLCTTLSRL